MTDWLAHVFMLQSKKIGIVVRKGRRKIANVDTLLAGLAQVGERWCHNVTVLSAAKDKDQKCVVTFDKVMFGQERDDIALSRRQGGGDSAENTSRSSVEKDIVPLQEYAVLFGIQVSVMCGV